MENKKTLHEVLNLWFRQKSDGGLEAKLGYTFKDPELLAHALVHSSFCAGQDLPYESNNERLEFLGDSVLNMLTTEFLYKSFPNAPEGVLSKKKSAIVSGHACAQSSAQWDLESFVMLGKAEAKMNGRGKETILADAYEAVLGAIYLDGGLEEVRHILEKFHFPHANQIVSANDFINYKSEFLELLQAKRKLTPEYILVEESGPEHDKIFTIDVQVEGRVFGRGVGGNKKRAEQEASRIGLELLQKEIAAEEAELAEKIASGEIQPKGKKFKQRHVGLP